MEPVKEDSAENLHNGRGHITSVSPCAASSPTDIHQYTSPTSNTLPSMDFGSVAGASHGVVSYRREHISSRPSACGSRTAGDIVTSSRSVSHHRRPHYLRHQSSDFDRFRERRGVSTSVHWESADEELDAELSFKASMSNFQTGIYFLDVARRYAQLVVRHSWFDAAVGLVIVVNSVSIGMEQEFKLSGIEAPVLQALEHFFVCVYLVEVLLRFVGGGFEILRDHWVKFDVMIVLVSVATQWILDAEHLGEMRVVVLMRLARLARLARTVRLLISFRELWILVNGLLASAGIMLYTMLLIGLMIYAFALLGMELISIRYVADRSSDPLVDSIVAEYFSGLWITMLTLTRFVTLDGISAIYTPLVQHEPWLAVYFVTLILTIGIVLMDLITAVLVNEALEQAQQNKEANKVHEARQKKKVLRELRAFFNKIDDDCSGRVDLEEIMSSTDEDMAYIRGFIKENDLREVFTFLDINGDGELDIHEFCEGLYQAMVSQTPLDFKRIDKRVEGVQLNVQELRAMQCELLSRFDEVTQRLDALSHGQSRPCWSFEDHASDRSPRSPVPDVPTQGGAQGGDAQTLSTRQCGSQGGAQGGHAPAVLSRPCGSQGGDDLREVQDIMVELNHRFAAALGHQVSLPFRRDRASHRDEAAIPKPAPSPTEGNEDWHRSIPVEREAVRSNQFGRQPNQVTCGHRLRHEAKRHASPSESPRTLSRGPFCATSIGEETDPSHSIEYLLQGALARAASRGEDYESSPSMDSTLREAWRRA